MNRYSANLKFHVVLEMLSGEKSLGHVAKVYEVHPTTISSQKETFLAQGPELFNQEKHHCQLRETAGSVGPRG